MSDMQKENADNCQWFLRTGGEAIFGPVSTQGLIVWAEQGRILPGHEVSCDRKKWIQAVSMEKLDMRWFVDDGSGELRGPLNRLAAEALVKSGKVPDQSQIVSADEIETPSETEKTRNVLPEKPAVDHAAEQALMARVQELETVVAEQRERLAKRTNSEAIETVQRERDALAEQLKELTVQQETILRNAEKDARTSERKTEQLRQQIRKLEQQLEDMNSRLVLSDETVATAAQTQRTNEEQGQLIEQIRKESSEQVLQAAKEAESLREKLADAERRLEKFRTGVESDQTAFAQERESWQSRVSSLEQAVQVHEKHEAEIRQMLAERESECAASKADVKACKRRLAEVEAARLEAEQKMREAESNFAELLTDANARDNAYSEKIATLEKACAQPPDETARFYADQAAVYDLVKAEIGELVKTMELERTNVEQLKEWSSQRQLALLERKQTLLKQLGDSPSDMTRRAVREQPSDPNAARLRVELDELRAVNERQVRLAEERERDLLRKLRVLEAESTKLQGLAVEGDKTGRRLQELTELLRKREQELADERKNRLEERGQFQGSQQALLMRIESLEKSGRPTTPDEAQTVEARNVKIATWMRLKK